MKKLLLNLLLLASVGALANQRTKTYTFDFTNPEGLTPSVERSPEETGVVQVTNVTFTTPDGYVTLGFDKGTSLVGAELVTDLAANGKIPFLTLSRSTKLLVNATGANLLGFKIPSSDLVGGLTVESTGTADVIGQFRINNAQDYYSWPVYEQADYSVVDDQGPTSPVTSLTLLNASPAACGIHSVTVTYELPRDILTATPSIASGATVSSFTGIDLTFDKSMTVTSDAAISLTDADGNAIALKPATANGQVVSITPTTELTADGTYTLTVEAGSLEDADTYRNAKLTYTFQVLQSFDIVSVTPAEGNVEKLESGIVLTFGAPVGTVQDAEVTVTDATGTLVRKATAAASSTNTVTLTFTNATPIEEVGVYTVSIPEKLVYDAADVHYNRATTYTYNIGNVASAELQAEAAELLALTGVGYPKAGSATRAALAALGPNGTSSAYTTAIENYRQDTDVELPTQGNYYKVAAVSKSGAKLWLQYSGGAISLTSDATQASVLKAAVGGALFQFTTTPDGQYLLLPGATASSVSATSGTANNLTLAKLSASGATKEALGLLTIQGAMGGSTGVYAQANVSSSVLSTNADYNAVYFTETTTSGFLFVEAADAEIPVPNVQCVSTPSDGSSVEQLTAVTLTFPSLSAVTLANPSLIKLTWPNGQQTSPNSVAAVDGQANAYKLTFSDVTAGSYSLTVGKGAFTYAYTLSNGNTITAQVQDLTFNYSVTKGDDFAFDFLNVYQTYYKESVAADQPIKDVDLNNLTFYSMTSPISVSTQEVLLLNYNTNVEVNRGKFVVTTDPSLPDAKGVIKLQLNTPIEAGSLPDGQYVYVIYPGTFGDANYGAYLSGSPTVTKADCHVNGYLTYVFKVASAEADKKYPSEATLTRAKELLAKTGLGYPAADAATRTALTTLVANGEGEDATFNTAMDNYLAETNVVKPTAGKYYRIEAVSSTGAKVYLKYDGTSVTLIKTLAEATGFKAALNNDGTYTFATGDGKYLQQIVADAQNLSASAMTANNLTVAKLAVSGVAADKTFGLFSLSGAVNGTPAYTLANAETATIMTTVGQGLTSFTATLTNAISFAEVDKATIPVPAVSSTLSLASGSTVQKLSDVVVTFNTAAAVQLVDQSKVYVADAAGTKTAVTSVTPVSGAANQFAIKFSEIATDGTYTLNIEAGAFAVTFAETASPLGAITASYTVLVERPDAATLARAKTLLDKSGLGYPVENATTRTALQALVAQNLGKDETYQAAIEAFLAETNVVKPTAGTYYRIEALTANGQRAYLQYDGQRVTLTNDATRATGFKTAVNGDGTYTFVTGDGQYLRQIEAGAANVSASYSAATNNLTVGKLAIAGVDAEKTFGLFYLQGQLASGQRAYALVNVQNATILTDAAQGLTQFGTTSTNAITFSPIANTAIPVPTVDYELTPEAQSELEPAPEVTVRFKTNATVTLADATGVSLTSIVGAKTVAKTVTAVAGQANTFLATFDELPAGAYTLTVARGAFGYTFAETSQLTSTISASYTVKAIRPSEATLEKAEELLSNTGLGYPTATSASRIALEDLVSEGVGTDEDFQKAMDAYCAETNVELPTLYKYYTVAAVSSTGTEVYLKYADGVVRLTGNAQEATPFQVSSKNGGVLALTTYDGKYLTLPLPGNANLTAEAGSRSRLALGRLVVEGVDAATTLGLFSVSGYADEQGTLAYARVGVKSLTILTSADLDEEDGLRFTSSVTNGFRFAEVLADDLVKPEPTATVSLQDGAQVETLEQVVVNFDGVEGVTLYDAKKVYLADAKGTPTQPVAIEKLSETQYALKFINVQAGSYTLKVEDGAFAYTFFGVTTFVDGLEASYTVTEGVDFAYDFDRLNEVVYVEQLDQEPCVLDTDLNSLTLKTTEPLAVQPEAKVSLVDAEGKEVVCGHFIATSSDEPGTYAIKLSLDKAILVGGLASGQYSYLIPAAAFGDANYGKYLSDPNSISMDECHVNQALTFTVNVDNDTVLSVEAVRRAAADGSVYDLQGRKVEGRLKAGQMYVKNGRKFIAK